MQLDVRFEDVRLSGRKAVISALALASALTLTSTPASALDARIGGIDGRIGVTDGFGACASLSFTGGVVAGEFTAFAAPVPTGVASADESDVPVVLDVVPFVATGSTWSHCFSGSVVHGVGVYSLVATGPGGDFAQVLRCERFSSTLACS